MTQKPAVQKLARGCSHTVGAKRYVGWMPLDIFNALPEKIQEKLKLAVKNEAEAAEKITKSNEVQKDQTAVEQATAQKDKDEAAKASRKTGK